MVEAIPIPLSLIESSNTEIADLKARLAEADARNESLLAANVKLCGELSRTTMLLERAMHGGRV